MPPLFATTVNIMRDWLKTNKKWLIPTGMATVLVVLLFNVATHFQQRRHEVRDAAEVDSDGDPKTARTERQASPPPKERPGADLPPGMLPEEKLAVFSREPSPSAVTGRLEVAEAHERLLAEKKLMELQVIWPLYFFSIKKRHQESATVMLDASEDGFGVLIVTDIDISRYPGILTAQPGDLIWVAGRITEIDTQGTGQITLAAEYIGPTGRKGNEAAAPNDTAEPEKQRGP